MQTAMMFEFEMDDLAETKGAAATLELKFHSLDLLRPVLLRFNAIPLEDVLYVFKDPEDAMDACIAAKGALDADNERRKKNGQDMIEISGFGMHTGTIVFVEGTDIHWGDPVNTSSKLGQDIAKKGQILGTEIVYNRLNAKNSRFSTGPIALKFTEFIQTISKVEMKCYKMVPTPKRKAYKKFKLNKKLKKAVKRVMCMERLLSMQHSVARRKAFDVMSNPPSSSSSDKPSKSKWSHMRSLAHVRHGLFSRIVKRPEDMNEEERQMYMMYDATSDNTNQNVTSSLDGTTPIQRRFSVRMAKWLKKSFFKQEICVLVSDLSGFTRLTRKYGVIHFASVIVRKRQLCLPILHKHGALFISTEADNFIVIMPSAVAGAKAANEMQSVIFQYNESLPPERDHFKIILNGIGLDCGIGVAVDRDDKLHGEVSNTAYHIGEDLCSDGRVLCSGRMVARLNEEKDIDGVWDICEGVTVEQGAEGESVFEIKSIKDQPNPDIVDTEDARYLHANLMPFARRHNTNITEEKIINTIDVEIKKHEQVFVSLVALFLHS